jgi:hypothetical protein
MTTTTTARSWGRVPGKPTLTPWAGASALDTFDAEVAWACISLLTERSHNGEPPERGVRETARIVGCSHVHVLNVMATYEQDPEAAAHSLAARGHLLAETGS